MLLAMQTKKDELHENKRKGLTVAMTVGSVQVWLRNTLPGLEIQSVFKLFLAISLMAHEYGDTKTALRH